MCYHKETPILFIELVQCYAEAAFLCHCHTNFKYDTAKTVLLGHLMYIDYGLLQDFQSISCVGNIYVKNNFVFHQNSHGCSGSFDWCIGFLNGTGTSIQ